MEPIWKTRVRQIVAAHGNNMKAVSKGAGLGETFVRDLLDRDQEPGAGKLAKLAAFHGVPMAWFFQPDSVPIVGYVRAGTEEILYETGQGPFGAAPTPPLASDSTVAVVVSGGSMAGRAEDGDLVYFDKREDQPTEAMIGRLCVIGLPDGRVVVKKLHRTNGHWLLISTSADPLIVESVSWAAPVIWIKPK